MRIRVRLDVTKPLCRGRKAKLEKGQETLISFKYERSPIFVIGVDFFHTMIRIAQNGY